jgi:PAS domain S-box-containing protein
MRSTAALPGFDDLTVFRSLFAAYPDALLLVDTAGTIVLANPAATALLGYAADELVSLTVDALVPDSIRPRHAAYREAYAKHPRPRPMGTTQTELVARHRDGSQVLVEISLSPLQEHGLPYVVAAIRGIAAYPRVKQALLRARYAEQVAQLGRIAVDARDPQLLLARVPRAAVEVLQIETCVVLLLEPNRLEFRVAAGVGLLPGEAIGDRLPNRPDTPAGHVLAVAQPVLVADYAAEQRFAVPRAWLDARHASGLSVPLSDRGSIVGALAVRARERQRFGDDELRFVESLASLLAASLQRAHTEEQLSHAQRLESVGQLTGGIAHDFNNLLTVISGNLQVLEELPAIEDDATARQMLGAATRASRRAAELTGKLLAFSRRQVLQPNRVDVAALLGSLTGMLRRTLDQRIALRLDASADCPPCLADPGQLEAALLNVAINARDAMPEGGTLSFYCRALDAPPAALRNELDLDTAYIAIAVADTGTGMPEAVRERAFEPFFTTKEAGRGTGLGLSTVYGFAKQSNGAVMLDSAVGAGTTVTLVLPQFHTQRERGGRGDEAGAEVPAGLRVLLVEDDAEVRAVVLRFLDALGCRVSAAVDAEQALAALDADVAAFDLLLSDIALGSGMRGTELARLARQRRPQLPVLLMTGFASGVVDTPPGFELLRKPYTRVELAQAISRVLPKSQ